jgi:hypothetical protein
LLKKQEFTGLQCRARSPALGLFSWCGRLPSRNLFVAWNSRKAGGGPCATLLGERVVAVSLDPRRMGFSVGLTYGYSKSLVPKIKESILPTICGSAACYAGWLRLPVDRPQKPTAFSPRRSLSLRRDENAEKGG